jgi:hypothetical protein
MGPGFDLNSLLLPLKRKNKQGAGVGRILDE